MKKVLRWAMVMGILMVPSMVKAEGMALGIQGGIGEFGNDNQPYYAIGLRVPFSNDEQGNGLRGMWEPEVTYTTGDSGDDTSYGINLIGAVSQGSITTYLGGGLAVHDIKYKTTSIGDDGTKVGANFQAGVDLSVTDSVSLFGQGRIDFVEGQRARNVLGRATIGIRFHF